VKPGIRQLNRDTSSGRLALNAWVVMGFVVLTLGAFVLSLRLISDSKNQPPEKTAVENLSASPTLRGAQPDPSKELDKPLSSGTHHLAGDSNDLPLAESERVYLSEIEHRAQILAQKAFPEIATALELAEGDALLNFFSLNFEGTAVEFSEGFKTPNQDLSMQKVVRDQLGITRHRLDRQAFADLLLSFRAPFLSDPKASVKLMSLLPIEREKLDGAWYGNFQLRIVGATETEAIRELMMVVDFVFNEIADPDQMVLQKHWIESLRIEEGYVTGAASPLMAEVSSSMGIDQSLFVDNWKIPVEERGIVNGGIYLADVNNDGRDDMLINDYNGLFFFVAQPGGGFRDATEKFGLPSKYHAAANAVFGDFDNDGWVDLIVDNVLLKNLQGKRFGNISQRSNLRLNDRQANVVSGYNIADYDKDGLIDLYVSRNHGDGNSREDSWIDGPGGPGNQLWKNLGDWQFQNVSKSANAQAGRRSVFTSAFLDANSDSWPDIYSINEFGGGILLVNQGDGTFREQELVNDAGDFGSMGLIVGDTNNDGHIDIYTANMYSKAGRRIMENLPEGAYPPEVFAKIKRFVTGSELYQNQGDLTFKRVGKQFGIHAVGWAYGPMMVDLDNNGFLDIYANAGFFSVETQDPDG
jgi:hypothetical protein